MIDGALLKEVLQYYTPVDGRVAMLLPRLLRLTDQDGHVGPINDSQFSPIAWGILDRSVHPDTNSGLSGVGDKHAHHGITQVKNGGDS